MMFNIQSPCFFTKQSAISRIAFNVPNLANLLHLLLRFLTDLIHQGKGFAKKMLDNQCVAESTKKCDRAVCSTSLDLAER